MNKNPKSVNQFNIQKFIYILLGISFVVIIFNSYNFIQERSPNQYSDWLINYQGGFVRRGLAGEVLFQLYNLLKIPLDSLVLTLIIFLYSVFYFLLFKIIKKIKFNFITLLAILSPLSFLYPVMEQKISGRKDILFLAFVLIVIHFIKNFNFKNQKFYLFLVFLITTFTHSGFIFYTPYLVTIFILTNIKRNFKELTLELFWIGSSLIFITLVILNYSSITPNSVEMLCQSIQEFLPNCGKQDYLESLTWSLSYEKSLVNTIWTREGYQLFYLISFVLAFGPLGYLLNISEFNEKKIKNFSPLLIFSLLILFTFPVYYIGADFGRYMFWSYLSSIIIFFYFVQNKTIKVKLGVVKINKIMILVIFLYCFTWTIPHCCNNNFKFIYKKPIENLTELLN